MPLEGSLLEDFGRFNFKIKSQELDPVLTKDVSKLHMLDEPRSHSLGDCFHDIFLSLSSRLVNSYEILLRFHLNRLIGDIEIQMLDALCQIVDVNGWDSVFARSHDGKRGQVRVQTQPCASVKLIENVVRLSVSIGQA